MLPHVPTGPRGRRKFLWLLVLIEVTVGGALLAPTMLSLSLKVVTIAPQIPKEAALSTVTAVGAICALVGTPVFGHYSDWTHVRWGRRRPWILGGVVMAVPGMALTASAPNLAVLTIGWAVTQLAYAATIAAVYGLLADIIPERERAGASGLFGAGSFAGMIPSLVIVAALKQQLALAMLVLPVVAVIVVALILRHLPDTVPSSTQGGRPPLPSAFAALVVSPARHPQFMLAWGQRFIIQFGYTILTSYAVYFLMTRLQMPTGRATDLSSAALIMGALACIVAALLFGSLASRRGWYTPFVVFSIAMVTTACLIKAGTTSVGGFWAANIIAGLGLGVYYSVDLALVMRAVPAAETGRFLGVFNVAKALPQSLAPALAPVFLTWGGPDPFAGSAQNYAALYLTAAVLVVLSVVPLHWMSTLRRLPGRPEPDSQAAAERPLPPASSRS